jgi:hypothetical protein
MALVQRAQCGRRGPIRSGQLGDADGVQASGIDHSVEDSNADGGTVKTLGVSYRTRMTGRVFHRLGIRNGAGFAPIEDRGRHAFGLAMAP